MRGGLSFELEVRGPQRDLHSGLYGGAVHNPLQALCEIIGKLHDRQGRVTIPRFYDRVRTSTETEREYLAEAGPDDTQLLRNAGAEQPWGETGYTEYERTTLRPALTVNGIVGGYSGPGTKGVIPSRALAKLSFRLVPDQDPREIEASLRRYLASLTPPTVRSTLRVQSRSRPVVLDRNLAVIRAAEFAYRKAFGKRPRLLRCGGTIPVVDTFRRVLKAPTVLMGFALPNDGMHGPNEKFELSNFHRGIATSIWFLHAASRALRAEQQAAHVARAEHLVPAW